LYTLSLALLFIGLVLIRQWADDGLESTVDRIDDILIVVLPGRIARLALLVQLLFSVSFVMGVHLHAPVSPIGAANSRWIARERPMCGLRGVGG
jgi:hypothetical protein